MASFIFEEGTQTDASGFQSGDTLIFKTATPTDLGVTFTAATGLSTDTVTLTFGDQSLTFAASALHGGTENFLAGGELVIGSSLADTSLTLTGDDAGAAYGFSAGDDITVSGAGAHIVDGGTGDDTVDAGGSTGGVYLFGGAGNDTIYGGSGNDHIYGNSITTQQGTADGNDFIQSGDGSNYVNGNAGNDTIEAGAGSNHLFGGAGNDVITTGDGNNTINGNTGDDTITTGNGNNVVRGGQGDDLLTGGTGNDVLMGDVGNDTIHGGAGVDTLTGGAGTDHFTFAAGDAAFATTGALHGFYDTITDFTHGTDQIDLGFAVDKILTQQAGVTFTSADAAETYAQQLLTAAADDHAVAAVVVGSDTYLFYNGAGTATSIDSAIKLDGISDATTLTHTATAPATADII